MSNGFFVLILKCTEAPTATGVVVPSPALAPVEGEDTNVYEKIHMYQLNNINDGSFNELKKFDTNKSEKNENDKNHAIIIIKLTNDNISNPTEDYKEIKYFNYEDISNNFISQINTATEINCYQSTYDIKGITPDTNNTYAGLKLDEQKIPSSKNVLINNGGKIVVTSSKNNDQMILHHVSKMFGFQDIIIGLNKDLSVVTGGGETNDFTAEELAEYQNQMEQQQNQFQEGGKKKRSKQNTKKKNQK
jgi:hypothetical protein